MLVPARKINAGAQKWVIQRVKKTPGGWASGRKTGIDAHVIDGHHDHHRAADEIDGRDPGFRRSTNRDRSGSEAQHS